MASGSGIVLHTGTYSQLRMDWSSTPNTATNQSSFSATLYVQVTTDGWNIGPWTDVSGSYFGTSTGNTFNGSIGNIATGRHNLKTFTTTVNHASDGKGSITMHWKWGVNSSWGGVVNPSGSRTLTLDTIARTSKHTLSYSSRNFGDTLTITTNRASSSFTHKLWCQYAGRNVDIATGVTTSYAWAIPKDWANHLSDGVSTPMNVICDTYSGSAKIGSHVVQITINVSDTSEFQPRITGTSLVPGNDIGSSFSGLFVKGKSTIKATMSTAGAYSSWIKTNEIKANGQTFSAASATTAVLSTAGTNTVSFKIIDSRNRTATSTANITVVDYADPSPTEISAVRCNSAGVEDDEGSYARIVVSASISPVDNKNTKSFKLQFRVANDGSDAWTTVNLPSTDYTLTNYSTVVPGFDVDSAYEIQLVATDAFSERVRSFELPTAFTLMDFRAGGKGISLGEVATEDGLSVNLDANFKKQVNITLNQTEGINFNFADEKGNLLASVSGSIGGVKVVANNGVETVGTWGTMRRDLLYKGTLNAVSNSIQTAFFTMPVDVPGVWYYDEFQVLFLDRNVTGKEGRKVVTIWENDNYWMASDVNPIDITISTGNWVGLRCQQTIASGKHSTIYEVYGVKYPIQNTTTLD